MLLFASLFFACSYCIKISNDRISDLQETENSNLHVRTKTGETIVCEHFYFSNDTLYVQSAKSNSVIKKIATADIVLIKDCEMNNKQKFFVGILFVISFGVVILFWQSLRSIV